MDKATIIALAQLVILPLIGYILNFLIKRRELKTKEEAKERDKERDNEFEKKVESKMSVVTNKINSYELLLTEFETTLKEIKDLLRTHVGTDDFIESFANSVRFVSNEILSWTKMVDDNFKLVLSSWTETMIIFGKNYYNDKSRYKDKDIFKNHLQGVIDRYQVNFYKQNDSLINGMRKHGGKFLRFSELLKISKIHNRTDYLVGVLSENGFETDKEIKNVFLKYIRDFFELYFTAVTTWETLEQKTLAA